jgi:hypothetical protein
MAWSSSAWAALALSKVITATSRKGYIRSPSRDHHTRGAKCRVSFALSSREFAAGTEGYDGLQNSRKGPPSKAGRSHLRFSLNEKKLRERW